jgi:hypothetical protein
MPNLSLKPSDILYSQSSIANKFTNGLQIGEVLDDIMEDFIAETPSRILIKTQTVHLETDFIYITSFFRSPISSRTDTNYVNPCRIVIK